MKKEIRNQRAEHSRMTIREALLELLGKKEFMDITVTDICAYAGISRGTFYSHYKNTHQVVDELFDEAIHHISNVPLQHIFRPDSSGKCEGAMCCFLRANKKYQPLFFSDSLYSQAIRRVVEFLAEGFLTDMKSQTDMSEDMLRNLLYYQISGCMAITRRFLSVSDEEWKPIQENIDAFLCRGFRNL